MPGHLHRLALCLVLASVFARVGEAQVLRDITLNGTDRMKISLRADARVKTSVLVNGTLEIDDTGGLSYRNTAGFELAGTIDTSGKQPVISLDETLLENEIMEAIVQVLPGTVVTSVELGKTRVRIAAKDRKGAITAKLGLGVGFTATALQGELQGKLVMGAKLSEAPLCTACGKLFEGTDNIDQSFEACDGFSVSGSGAATLEIFPDSDGDGSSAWRYTDSSGLPTGGTLTQLGRTIECQLDGPSRAILAVSLAAAVFAECRMQVVAAIGEETCSGKLGASGTSLSFGFAVEFDAGGPGESKTRGKLKVAEPSAAASP
jgi:hypothetical protein